MTPLPLLHKLHKYITHSNPRIRAKASVSVSQCVSKMVLVFLTLCSVVFIQPFTADLNCICPIDVVYVYHLCRNWMRPKNLDWFYWLRLLWNFLMIGCPKQEKLLEAYWFLLTRNLQRTKSRSLSHGKTFARKTCRLFRPWQPSKLLLYRPDTYSGYKLSLNSLVILLAFGYFLFLNSLVVLNFSYPSDIFCFWVDDELDLGQSFPHFVI